MAAPMSTSREFAILGHLYGSTDGKVVCLRNAKYHATGNYAGAWVGPGFTYYPGGHEVVISSEEAAELVARKLAMHGVGWDLVPTAPGRERWKALLREAAQ